MGFELSGSISSGFFGSHRKTYTTLPVKVEKPSKQGSAAKILLTFMKKNIDNKREAIANFLNLGMLFSSFEFFILDSGTLLTIMTYYLPVFLIFLK
jgi:hypothetical protein